MVVETTHDKCSARAPKCVSLTLLKTFCKKTDQGISKISLGTHKAYPKLPKYTNQNVLHILGKSSNAKNSHNLEFLDGEVIYHDKLCRNSKVNHRYVIYKYIIL